MMVACCATGLLALCCMAKSFSSYLRLELHLVPQVCLRIKVGSSEMSCQSRVSPHPAANADGTAPCDAWLSAAVDACIYKVVAEL